MYIDQRSRMFLMKTYRCSVCGYLHSGGLDFHFCPICNALDRVLRVHKDGKQWLETVNSMVEITGDPNFLTSQEKKDIV
ncbi:MAG: hypothetical protein D3925_20665, partial [Candidatus Electrothrix sp. AR5]|nr:hypothetical protein [Candidatus Electrothrix sp. AR5]